MTENYSDTIQVRQGEELNKERLQAFITAELPEVPTGELVIEQFGSGHSNLTYLLKIADWEAVLRRPPHGPVAPKAHDMEREFTFLSRLYPEFPVAPKPYLFSKDESVVGSPFFIMERRKGIVLDTAFPSSTSYHPDLGRKISQMMVNQLVALHEVDSEKTGLIQLAKPAGFMERQVKGWIHRYERAKTDEVDQVEELMKYLEDNIPSTSEATVIHYDYKLNNAMFTSDYSEMTGLFDWEMSTIGDPLADVAVAMSYWIQNDDDDVLKYGLGTPPVTVNEGFFTRDEFIDAYQKASGRDVSRIDYYLTFAYFKLAVIGQQIYYRYKQGQTKDPRFKHLNVLVNNMIQQAVRTM